MFYKMNTSHIHLCIFCVICLIFISKWDPFRNKSYQRETILKINRYLLTFFWKCLQSTTHWRGCMYNARHFGVWLKKKRKEKKKKGNPGIRTHANLHTVFLRYTLSPVGHGGVLFQCEEEPFDISLLNLCDKTWSNVNKSSRFTVKIWWFFAHSLHF